MRVFLIYDSNNKEYLAKNRSSGWTEDINKARVYWKEPQAKAKVEDERWFNTRFRRGERDISYVEAEQTIKRSVTT